MNYGLPDLIALQVVLGKLIHEFQFLLKIFLQLEQGVHAPLPEPSVGHLGSDAD